MKRGWKARDATSTRWALVHRQARDAINAGAQGVTMYTVAHEVGHQKGGSA
jgi:hypothetical protein